jgi:hypothetical protein
VNLLDGLDDDDNGLGGLIAPPQTEKALPTLGNQAVSLDGMFSYFVKYPVLTAVMKQMTTLRTLLLPRRARRLQGRLPQG